MGRYYRNGYVLVYKPEHHRAERNGLVYEHVYLAEVYLGRELKSKEVVHHKDENRSNNREDNIIVFRTGRDHLRYHKTGILVEESDGTFTSPRYEDFRECEQCGYEYNAFLRGSRFCSKNCYDNSQRRVERPSKGELLSLIMSTSFVKIGEKYNVSDNSVRKWCKIYGLPHRKKDIKKLV